jgi:phosphonate transport system substrate-binding protein
VVLVLVVAGMVSVASAPAQEPGLERVELRMGFTRASFLGVNGSDAKAAFKVFAARMGEKRGYDISPEVRIFDDLDVLHGEIERGTQDLLIVDAWDYIALSPGDVLPAEFVTVEQGVVMQEYLLLVGADSEVSGWADLEGKHVVVINSTNATVGRRWLRTELLSLGVAEPRTYFARLELEHRISKVVLPVFFGQADACLVDRAGFEVMVEMNPQVGTRLRAVKRSEPFLDTVACVRAHGWAKARHRTDLLEALEELPNDPAGQQIMTLFRFEAMAPFDDRYLESVRALFGRHRDLAERLDVRAGDPWGER